MKEPLNVYHALIQERRMGQQHPSYFPERRKRKRDEQKNVARTEVLHGLQDS